MQRRILAALILATLFGGGIEPLHFRILLGDRTAPLPDPDGRTPEYPKFLEGIAAQTSPGDSIAIVAPFRYWGHGYRYAYYRANYILAGRKAVPILDDADHVRRERLLQVDFVALWQFPELPESEVVWRGHGGALQRRTR